MIRLHYQNGWFIRATPRDLHAIYVQYYVWTYKTYNLHCSKKIVQFLINILHRQRHARSERNIAVVGRSVAENPNSILKN